VWLGVLNGPAATIRDLLKAHIDSDDGLMVVELKAGSEWATFNTLPGGAEWFKKHILP
jgi:hypothetical protein